MRNIVKFKNQYLNYIYYKIQKKVILSTKILKFYA